MMLDTSFRLFGPSVSWPVVVADGNDVMVFENIHDLQRRLEIADLDSYAACDANAKPLALWSTGGRIELRKSHTEGPSGFSPTLKAFLRGCGREPKSESFAGLLDEVVQLAGFTR